ncbi:MAG TPA: hypothetical protein PK095_07240, partial [Myxococcota bacterium]|nr:hypothetical protein [Myxococcota bacterium]
MVQQHVGLVRCDSTPGRGTTFEVYLDRIDRAGRARHQRRALQKPGFVASGVGPLAGVWTWSA